MSETPTAKILTESEVKTNTPNPGWERILAIYDGLKDGRMSFELDSFRTVTKTAFMAGFLTNGISGFQPASERYDMHSTGKTFISKRDVIRRKFDFSVVMFAKNGFIGGMRTSALAGSVIFFTTHLAAYRDKFSYLYFPLVSGSVFGVLAFPLGIVGCMKAVALGLSSGSTLSIGLALYGLFKDKSSTDVYKEFKREYEEKLSVRNEEERKLREFMKTEGIYFKYMALVKMKERENKKLLEESSLEDVQ